MAFYKPKTPTFLGNPCPYGHEERYVSNGKCVACAKLASIKQKGVRHQDNYGESLINAQLRLYNQQRKNNQ